MGVASVLVIGLFSLVVLVAAFAWVCLLEIWAPLCPKPSLNRRAGVDRRCAQAADRRDLAERRRGDRRREGRAMLPLSS